MCPVGNPLDEEELSRLTAKSREQVLAFLKFLRENGPGWAKAVIEQTACSLGIRESRRIMGNKVLNAKMVLGAVKLPDAIGHGIWMIDIHDPLGSGYTTWNDHRTNGIMLEAGTSYHIPLGMCLNSKVCNLAVAGRCALSTHECICRSACRPIAGAVRRVPQIRSRPLGGLCAASRSPSTAAPAAGPAASACPARPASPGVPAGR